MNETQAYQQFIANIKAMPLDFSVVTAVGQITDRYELHDRIIAGTALFLNVPIITNDPVITASEFVETVW